MADCSGDKKATACYKAADKPDLTYKCADWTTDDGTVTMGCAAAKECGQPVTADKAYKVACSGLAGDACTMDTDCDPNAKYRCGMQFDN